MSDDPDYVVIRPAPDLPPGFLPSRWDGLWLDRSTMESVAGYRPGDAAAKGWGEGVAVPTGQFEYREDGAVAEVWEVRP